MSDVERLVMEAEVKLELAFELTDCGKVARALKKAQHHLERARTSERENNPIRKKLDSKIELNYAEGKL